MYTYMYMCKYMYMYMNMYTYNFTYLSTYTITGFYPYSRCHLLLLFPLRFSWSLLFGLHCLTLCKLNKLLPL